ncbi:RNA-directed DNA polymerase, eukaryota, partial [Tanacetum coccineum]
MWPRPYVDFASSDSVGASGGILTVWDSQLFSLEHKVVNRSFLGVIGAWVGASKQVGLLNVYAPQLSSLKDQLWIDIKNFIKSYDAVWILFGDFNVVRCHDERIRSFLMHMRRIRLKVGSQNLGPKPYRIFDKWIGVEGFKE